MSVTYSSSLNLGLPTTGEATWGSVYVANFGTILDGLAPLGGLNVATTEVPSATLNVKVAAGNFINASGVRTAYAGTASFACTSSNTNYVFLDNSGTLTRNVSGFPTTACIPLATVVASGTTITSVADARAACNVAGSNLGFALLAGAAFTGAVSVSTGGFTVTAGGITLNGGNLTLADAVNLAIGTTTGTQFGTATSAKLGWWGATPVVQPAGASQAAWAALNASTITDNTGGSSTTTLASLTNAAAITDSTGGTPATTFAAITAPAANATTSLTADMTAVKNALAEDAAQWNLQVAFNTAVKNALASIASDLNNIKTDLTNGRTLVNQVRGDLVTIGKIKGSA